MTLAQLLAALGLTSSAEIEQSIGTYVEAQTAGLKRNRDQLFNDNKKLKDQVAKLGDLDVDELSTAISELDLDMADVVDRLRQKPSVDPKNPDVAKQIADAVAAAETKLQRKIAAAEKKTSDAENALQAANKARIDETIERSLTGELATQKGNVDLLLPMLRGRVKGEIDPDTGKVNLTVLAPNGDEMQAAGGQVATVTTLIETIKADERFGAVFEAEGGGSGAGGSKTRAGVNSGKNPYMKGTPHYSLTEQAALREKNPALAAQLKAAAERAA